MTRRLEEWKERGKGKRIFCFLENTSEKVLGVPRELK